MCAFTVLKDTLDESALCMIYCEFAVFMDGGGRTQTLESPMCVQLRRDNCTLGSTQLCACVFCSTGWSVDTALLLIVDSSDMVKTIKLCQFLPADTVICCFAVFFL